MKENNILFATTTKQSSDSCDMNKKQSEDECILPEISSGSSEPVNTKQQAVWDKRATLALLALYEANIENIDHPKKKTKIWSKISMGLLEHGIEVSFILIYNVHISKVFRISPIRWNKFNCELD
ncbi:uncharacterized protein LOC112467965 [Temnothorax curvispinosus]|nr:uncharacterized protein LOC112467965 [Temnothorax curvispinosus]